MTNTMTPKPLSDGSKSFTLPAGSYELIQFGEGCLVGTRSGVLEGLIPWLFDGEAPEELVQRYFEGFDELFGELKAGVPVAAEIDGQTIAFLPDANMGKNHCGWTDGFFLIPTELFESWLAMGASKSPLRHRLNLEDSTAISTAPHGEADGEFYDGRLLLGGKPLEYGALVELGSDETL